MAIQGDFAVSQIASALGNNSSRFVIEKASLSNQVTNTLCSMWRSPGQPGQGAIPGTTPVVPTKDTLGAIGFQNQTDPVKSYLAWLQIRSSIANATCEIHDRLLHMGGLALNVTTLQTITGMDLSTAGIPVDRLGAPDYSDVIWFLETYADGGATAANATINVTFHDATSANLNVLAVGGTLRASRLIPLTPLIPLGSQGKFIQSINSVQNSASTGTAGNFGFTAVRNRTAVGFDAALKSEVRKWDQLGFPDVPNDSCLMMAVMCATTSSGTLGGNGKIAHG